MKRINEIVVVEGKTDSQLLKELYDVDTIETHGLGLDDKTLELIKEASKTRGVIVLTDPDYPGLRIRNQVATTYSFLPDNCFTAFAFKSAHASSEQGLLSFLYSSEVHHTESSLASFFTKNLSFGERPV